MGWIIVIFRVSSGTANSLKNHVLDSYLCTVNRRLAEVEVQRFKRKKKAVTDSETGSAMSAGGRQSPEFNIC